MSRSGYSDDVDDIALYNLWRGSVASAMRGKRGQDFLKEMASTMDAMPVKRLVDSKLEIDADVCAIGAVGRARGVDMSAIDPEDYSTVAAKFGIAEAMAREVVYMNDEELAYWREETPEQRFVRMRNWIESEIKK